MSGRIIRFGGARGGDHREAQELLPWYVTGRLEPEEQARVETHLAGCAECRAELRQESRLRAEIADLPLATEQAWAGMRDRVTGGWAQAAARSWRRTWAGQGGGPRWVPWLLTLQTAALAAVVVLLMNSLQAGRYHVLAAGPPTRGDVLVLFRPEAGQAAVTGALQAAGARIADGPTAAGAYLLSVPGPRRDAALAALRRSPVVDVAEPVGPGFSP
jgi:anti-sigma factor RsiW